MLIFIVIMAFVGLSVSLAWFLLSQDHGEREPILALWMAAGVGVLAGLAAGIIESYLVSSKNLLPGASIESILIASLLIGLIEETCKFVPIGTAMYRKSYFNEHTDGILYFALAGLGFGLPENILYTAQFGAKTGMARIILTPLFHAATTSIIGYFLIRKKLEKRSWVTVAIPLGAVVVLHGLYDFGLVSGQPLFAAISVAITLSLSVVMFGLYTRAAEFDQDGGLSVVGQNKFCRSCGTANPRRNLYCTNCGKNA